MSRRNHNDDNELITVDIEPQQIRPLAYELQRARIPFQFYQDPRTQQYSVETHQAAQPILQMVLKTTERWDVFSRKPEHRNRLDDGLGFVLSFMALGTIIFLSGQVADWANEIGISGDIARGVVILLVGVAVTLVWSELFMHHDQRRGLFRTPMILLFGCAAAWFILTGMGWDMAGELARLMP